MHYCGWWSNKTVLLDKKLHKSVKEQFNLENKTILITGGAGFLGYYFAEAMAEMNANTIIVDKNPKTIAKTKNKLFNNGYNVDSYEINITEFDSVKEVVENIIDKNKQIDVLINAAQYSDEKSNQKFEDYELKYWQNSLDVNLTGLFLTTQAVGKQMKVQKKGGVIVNVASDVGIISPDHRIYQPDKRFDYEGVPFNTPIDYSVSKAGVLAFTRFLATYWAKDSIRVNSISPAGVYNNQDSKFVEQLSYRIPLNRMADPNELKGPLVYLCSEASSFMTGANLVVDGGRTIW